MIEYLYDAIRATANTDTEITARITGDDGNAITSDCSLMLHNDKEEMIATIKGKYNEEEQTWLFVIPKDTTKGCECKRYWYCICHEDSNLCFKQPIYFK